MSVLGRLVCRVFGHVGRPRKADWRPGWYHCARCGLHQYTTDWIKFRG